MSMRSLTQTKAESSFTPVQTGLLQRQCASCGQRTIARAECAECQKKRMPLQRRAANQAEPAEVPPIVGEVLRAPGQPLDSATRDFMESRFRHDFSQVKVHTNTQAAQSARAVNALAYTVGRNVVFAAGQYAPGSRAGKRLLAHELTHVLQQANSSSPLAKAMSIGQPDDQLEREAEYTAQRIVSTPHGLLPAIHQSELGAALQRQPDTCPSSRAEELEHPGTCPDIARERGELERFARFGPAMEVIVPTECYLLSNLESGSTEFGVLDGLNAIADLVRLHPATTVHITGFTDCKGSPSRNANLRMNRATAVEEYLIDVLGVEPARVFIEPTSATEYVDTNTTAEGRARNRSVAIYLEHEPAIAPREDAEAIPQHHAGQLWVPFMDLQIHCIAIQQGGCTGGTRPAGVPDDREILSYHERCQAITNYAGTPLRLADLQCGQTSLAIAQSLERSYPGWRDVLPDCPCTAAEARRQSGIFEASNAFISTYHPGAAACFRSREGYQTAPGTSHGQQCCYDSNGALITEGQGAGTPDAWKSFWNHQSIDVTPWEDLGSETYNRFWVPNNGNNCPSNRVP